MTLTLPDVFRVIAVVFCVGLAIFAAGWNSGEAWERRGQPQPTPPRPAEMSDGALELFGLTREEWEAAEAKAARLREVSTEDLVAVAIALGDRERQP